MRRPAPPPPAEDVVDLDYGSADGPHDSSAQFTVTDGLNNGAAERTGANEVDPADTPTHPTAGLVDQAGRERRRPLAYDTDAFDPASLQPSNLSSQTAASDGAQGPRPLEPFGSSSVTAVPGRSSPGGQHGVGSDLRSGSIGSSGEGVASSTTLWQSDAPQHPPPPIEPPPALPLLEEQYHSAYYAYDPNAPEFHPSLHPLAPPALHAGFNAYYAASASQSFNAGLAETYAHPAGSVLPYGHDLPYDPQAPHNPFTHEPAQHSFQYFEPYPPITAAYPAAYHGDQSHRPTGQSAHHMDRFQLKRLHKQQKKKEKKQRRREQKSAAAHAAAYDVASVSASARTAAVTRADASHVWVQDGEAQASAMIRELHARGVPPGRLVEHGIPLTVIEDCCVKLGISAHGLDTPTPEGTTTPPTQQHVTSAVESAGQKSTVAIITPAESELLSKEQNGHALTPLEELRRKVLASRLAKAAAASNNNRPKEEEGAVAPADEKGDQTPPVSGTTTAFERTTTSGEAGALLSQIAESIRSLLRPSSEASMTVSREAPAARAPSYPTQSTRKRSYRDVDAVGGHLAGVTADLIGEENTALPGPSRRQRISYADNFSRAAVAPSGEVDLDAPVPNLPDFSEMMTSSFDQADTPLRRRRPVAADFDTEEYRPQIVQPNRFLDVPSGLNTVIDLSDDEIEDKELDAFEAADGWTAARPDMDPRDVLTLRQKTATEHYDNFCALNGLQPVRRAVTPQHEGSASAIETAEASTAGISAARDGLLAQLAASGGTSAGSSTPSRDELLRKELEIKQLTRRIQMMEERKSRQQTSSASPPVSPLPSRYLQKAASSQTHPINGSVDTVTVTARVTDTSSGPSMSTKRHTAEAVTKAKEPARTSSAGNGSSLRLDPALSKQREHLLAMLASKRKNTGAAAQSEAKLPIDTVHTGAEDDAHDEPAQAQHLQGSESDSNIEAAKAQEASEPPQEVSSLPHRTDYLLHLPQRTLTHTFLVFFARASETASAFCGVQIPTPSADFVSKRRWYIPRKTAAGGTNSRLRLPFPHFLALPLLT